jgi:hypothetical protein
MFLDVEPKRGHAYNLAPTARPFWMLSDFLLSPGSLENDQQHRSVRTITWRTTCSPGCREGFSYDRGT